MTFIGLAIAVFAIVGPVTRLRLRLQLWRQVWLATLAVLLVLYFQFFELVGLPCPHFAASMCPAITFPEDGSVTPQMAAFVIVLLWMLAAFSIAVFAKSGPRSLKTIEQIVARLAYEQRYSELLDFIEPHLAMIQEADGESADTITRMVYRSRPLLRFIAAERPSIAPRLLNTTSSQRFEFSDRLLEALLQAPDSLIYDELHQNQNLTNENGYVIPDSNVLLRAYFADISVAAKLGAYKPVGEEILRLHGPGLTPEYRAFMNGNASRFDEERWRDPTHAAIWFFDVMVRAAVVQNYDDHMWLYYMHHFVECLEANFDPKRLEPVPHAEFPSRSAHLIYRCFSVLDDWVLMAKTVPANSPHAAVPNSPYQGASSIPAGAASCMGDCLYSVVMSERLPRDFRLAMFQQALGTIRKLDPAGPIRKLRDFLILSLLTGGRRGASAEYADRIEDLYADSDHVLRSAVMDLRTVFSETYNTNLT